VTVAARAVGFKPSIARVLLTAGTLTQDFKLAENPLQLGEIVVTGAGTVSEVEKLGTGRSTVDSTAIQRSNEYNVVNALAAKAPNVNVTSQSGEPGSSRTSRFAARHHHGLRRSAADRRDGVPVDNSIQFNNPLSVAANASALPSNRALDINPTTSRVEILGRRPARSTAARGAGRHPDQHAPGPGGSRPLPLRSSIGSTSTGGCGVQTKYGLGTGGLRRRAPGGEINCRVGFAGRELGSALASGTPIDHSAEMFQDGCRRQHAHRPGGTDRHVLPVRRL
jgi:hypothetical protein